MPALEKVVHAENSQLFKAGPSKTRLLKVILVQLIVAKALT
jgi:hypothetical protein